MNFRIDYREVSISDVEDLYNFRKKILNETKFLITSPDEIMDFHSFKNYVRFYIENKFRNIFVAKIEKEIIGELVIMIHERKRMRHVAEFGISVLKEFRGIGIGKSLIQIAEKWAFERGVRRIQLEVMGNNLRAIGLYSKLGYKFEGRKVHAVNLDGMYVDLLIMAKVKE
ncbi:GNAT family N-acetyltransferase [Thermosipho melanesiensis]|uniref:GCN5-related N-acetyltransferase n=2 Tax=Thermosipho melanesiensis TaxID=46541 RepID=A6LNW5_THEM4|nr:GNAT family N-acetyltransferase [Thermosipho melanesiensis]ABR31616.1 GCN5-related N-acetyltransferase [Thermosipho melanesiensis BI429]APT74645.1 acetyltransferase [Thermosipho melanesiensis]